MTVTVPTIVLVLPVLGLVLWLYAIAAKRYVLAPLNRRFDRRIARLRAELDAMDGP